MCRFTQILFPPSKLFNKQILIYNLTFMQIDPYDLLSSKILELHIRVLKDILIKIPFNQILQSYEKEIAEIKYLEIIKNSGHLCFDSNNQLIGAYPVSPYQTDFLVDVEGIGQGHSMCAIDSLGLAYTFMAKTAIYAIDKSTEEPIKIYIDPNSDSQLVSDIHISYKENPTDIHGDYSAAKIQCPTINFYSSVNDIPTDLQIWDFQKALNYSKIRFGKQQMLSRIQDAIARF